MNLLLIANWVLFVAVVLHATGLFIYLLKTRTAYVKLGKKEAFERNLKEWINAILINGFGQRNTNSEICIGGETKCYHC